MLMCINKMDINEITDRTYLVIDNPFIWNMGLLMVLSYIDIISMPLFGYLLMVEKLEIVRVNFRMILLLY